MKIIILGAGQVGSSVAYNLASEANDITVVDIDSTVLQALQDKLDLRTVNGIASHPGVLRRAGAEDADMVVAVTNSDEVNMVACQVAYTLFHTPTKIARLRGIEYHSEPRLFAQEAVPVDVLITPELLVTDYVRRLIEYPGALQVLDFAGGRVRLVGVKAFYGGPLVGHELRTLKEHMPKVDNRVAAIYRQGSAIIPTGRTVIEADDEVFFVAAHENIREHRTQPGQAPREKLPRKADRDQVGTGALSRREPRAHDRAARRCRRPRAAARREYRGHGRFLRADQ